MKSPAYYLGYWTMMIVCSLFGGLLLMWYNHVLFQYPIEYWKLVILAAVIGFLSWAIKPMTGLMGMVFCVCVIGQILSWLHALTLPILYIIR
jgi:hypothetical protein